MGSFTSLLGSEPVLFFKKLTIEDDLLVPNYITQRAFKIIM